MEKYFRNYQERGKKAGKSGFGEGLLLAGNKHADMIALGADITASVGMDGFKKTFPERFYSLGIAEQNIAAVAAGLSLSGMLPVFSTYGVFAALRAADQIRISLCYNNIRCIIGGAHAGISVGPDGATHQALEDIAMMRVLPNMTVLSPCDATEVSAAVLAASKIQGPVYIRFGREAVPDFTEKKAFQIGKADILHKGKDLYIIATGHLVWESLQAVKILKKEGIDAGLINMSTIKPIDEVSIINAAKESGRILTAEEHQVNGGLGGAVAEVLSKHFPVPIEMIGMPDSFGESGKADELMKKYGMDAQTIVEKAKILISR